MKKLFVSSAIVLGLFAYTGCATKQQPVCSKSVKCPKIEQCAKAQQCAKTKACCPVKK